MLHKILYVLVQIMNEDILLDKAELDETYLTFEQEGYVRKEKGVSVKIKSVLPVPLIYMITLFYLWLIEENSQQKL